MKNRRRHFLINRPLQFRYMAYITLTLVTICSLTLITLYIGIWSSVLDFFSDTKFREDLLTAARMSQYEEARYPTGTKPFSSLAFFKQTEKLSVRQREIFKQVLDESNRKLASKLLILFLLIAWGSIYLSHKIAGPLYRFQATFKDLQNGDFTKRVYLRKFDEARAVCEDLNKTLQDLDERIGRLKSILRGDEGHPERSIPRLKEELARTKTSADL